ncbi:MAG: hypothetical protein KJ057_07410 [Phycisphaerae bacterium]|nr:MAG: hypothetical protein EDS66_04415 [Planctomycetota bacterium]KAB2939557.1 MAG: OB-fold nucleic acid binding domain-containing protein [Phycisphaerae bacterium]MBE7457024.1 OB-fold nucleic acid binding domain-containing protein [Planctomycetia bacterium]MCL4718286.1 hypothetical protein [Phycisphaerae bacterium]MCQ3920408.1 hypothetical protein [Planctomycetota bacterium]
MRQYLTEVQEMLALLMILACAAGEAKELDFAREYLHAAALQRESFGAGTLVVRYVSLDGNGKASAPKLLRCYFDGHRYRVDVVEDLVYRRLDKDARVKPGQPYEISLWDGSGVVFLRRFNVSSFQHQIMNHPKLGTPVFFNGKFLGFPTPYGPQVDLTEGMQLDYEIVGLERIGADVLAIKTRSTSDLDQTLVYHVDKSKGYALTRMQNDTTYPDPMSATGKVSYTAIITTTLSKRGESWFPSKVRHEQWKAGALDWVREYEVLQADLDAPPPAEVFRWTSTGIAPGDVVFSGVPGTASYTWTAR